MLVWKEVIPGPGTYWYRDQDSGLPRKITFNPEGIKHLHDSGKAMLAAGLSVPVPLEHQPDARPLSAADLAAQRLKNNAGWTKDYRLSGKGGLEAQLDIDDPELFARLPRTVRWVSPLIDSFTDGAGKSWDAVICHNALTSRPRITGQEPFGSLAAALSLAASLPDETFDGASALKRGGLRVSGAGLLVQGGGGPGLEPKYPVAFALLSGARLAVAELPPGKKAKKAAPPAEPEGDAAEEGKAAAGEAPEVAEAGGPEAEEGKVDGDGDISVYDVICDLLESEGYQLPPGTTEENFAAHMYECLMDKKKAAGPKPEGDAMDENKQPAENPGVATPGRNKPPVVAEQPPLYMSHEYVDKIEDPQLKQLARVALSLQNQALEQAKARRLARIERLCKRVRQQGFQDKLLAQAAAPAAALSLADDGAVRDPLAATLDILESGVRDLPALLTDPAGLSELGHPREYDGGAMTEERRLEVVGEVVRNCRLPEPPGKHGDRGAR